MARALGVREVTLYWNAHRHPFVWGHGRRHQARRRPGIAQSAVMDVVIIGTSLLGVLTLVLLAQAVIERRWQTKTQDHARDVFDSRVRPHLKPGLSAELLMRMAGYLIDADFFLESIANRLSDMPRRKRRGSFIELIRECCSDNDEIRGLAEDVFLLPLEERTTLRRAYGAVLVASLLLYSLSIFLFFSVTRPT